eukprot:gene26931-35628_t
MYSDSVVDFTELLESMGASLMDFGNNGQQKSKLGSTSSIRSDPKSTTPSLSSVGTQKKTVVKKIIFQDPPIVPGKIIKPPKEIFYRQTQLFLTSLPPAVAPKQCTCRYLCDGAMADIKCFSCCIYDPYGSALYCNAW